jgi:hypothetical protein
MADVYRYRVSETREVEVTAEDVLEAAGKAKEEFDASPTNYKVTVTSFIVEKSS